MAIAFGDFDAQELADLEDDVVAGAVVSLWPDTDDEDAAVSTQQLCRQVFPAAYSSRGHTFQELQIDTAGNALCMWVSSFPRVDSLPERGRIRDDAAGRTKDLVTAITHNRICCILRCFFHLLPVPEKMRTHKLFRREQNLCQSIGHLLLLS